MRVRPSPAIMKANSPIWASEKPDCMAIFNGWPDSNTPKLAKHICPIITANVIIAIGILYSQSS
ncbi:hypothetical protein EVA_11198 [gut metagenome]|uniref:Uncharacterized protein n=1 Tax=gut metagenome TaxID=749906 RepID=J9CKV4_9ZZZZ